MEKGNGLRSGFLIITGILVTGIAGYLYMNEKRFIENSATITARISEIRNEPCRRVLQIYTVHEQSSDSILSLRVPFWDSKQVGEQISVRISPETPPQAKVDEFMYLHKTSLGFLVGCLILFGILFRCSYFPEKGLNHCS